MSTADKTKMLKIKYYLALKLSGAIFTMLINDKMPTIGHEKGCMPCCNIPWAHESFCWFRNQDSRLYYHYYVSVPIIIKGKCRRFMNL